MGRRPVNGLSPNKAGLAEDTDDWPNTEFRPGVGRRGGGLLRVWGRALVLGRTLAGYTVSSAATAKGSVSATKPGLGEPRVSKQHAMISEHPIY